MQQEEEAKTSQGGNKSSQQSQNNQHHVTKWKQETGDDQYGEYIDMDMDDECVSDVDSET